MFLLSVSDLLMWFGGEGWDELLHWRRRQSSKKDKMKHVAERCWRRRSWLESEGFRRAMMVSCSGRNMSEGWTASTEAAGLQLEQKTKRLLLQPKHNGRKQH